VTVMLRSHQHCHKIALVHSFDFKSLMISFGASMCRSNRKSRRLIQWNFSMKMIWDMVQSLVNLLDSIWCWLRIIHAEILLLYFTLVTIKITITIIIFLLVGNWRVWGIDGLNSKTACWDFLGNKIYGNIFGGFQVHEL